MVPSTAFYPANVVVESVKKAQEEKSASVLSRALKMCHDKLVNVSLLYKNSFFILVIDCYYYYYISRN